MKTVVMSLGGSLIVPEQIDSKFLTSFVKLISKYVDNNHRFIIVCGGGKTARLYQDAAKKVTKQSNDQLDWIGIYATYVNAKLVQSLFGENAHPDIIMDPSQEIDSSHPIIIASGWKPGRSTDYDAILLASQFNASFVINMSNVEQVYSEDPKKNKNAKPLDSLTWSEYSEMVGTTWEAGMNLPFDPIAAQEAKSKGIHAYIVGSSLDNLTHILEDKSWKGTKIQ